MRSTCYMSGYVGAVCVFQFWLFSSGVFSSFFLTLTSPSLTAGNTYTNLYPPSSCLCRWMWPWRVWHESWQMSMWWWIHRQASPPVCPCSWSFFFKFTVKTSKQNAEPPAPFRWCVWPTNTHYSNANTNTNAHCPSYSHSYSYSYSASPSWWTHSNTNTYEGPCTEPIQHKVCTWDFYGRRSRTFSVACILLSNVLDSLAVHIKYSTLNCLHLCYLRRKNETEGSYLNLALLL